MARLHLFQWVGYVPRSAYPDRIPGRTHIVQASCAAAFPSKAAFMRATGRTPAAMPWVAMHEDVDPEEDMSNEGARLAVATPGVVFWQDDVRHPRAEAPWLVHDAPEYS